MFSLELYEVMQKFFTRVENSNQQKTFSGEVTEESPLTEIIESNEEMTHRLASIY